MGRLDVDGMLDEMTPAQFEEWMAYYSLEPWGEDRADMRVAQLTALTANINRAKGKPAYKMKDFLFDFDREPKPKVQALEVQMAMGRAMAQVFGGLWLKKGVVVPLPGAAVGASA